MKKLVLIISVALLSGCANTHILEKKTFVEQNQKFEKDNSNCQQLATTKGGSPNELTRMHLHEINISNSNEPDMVNDLRKNDNRKQAKTYDTCMFSKGWNKNDLFTYTEAYKRDIENQARVFFEQNPEFMNSKEKESQLAVEFQNVLNSPKYQELNLYETLQAARNRIDASKLY